MAVEVARSGLAATPAVLPPTSLMPVLGFKRLQGPALVTIRKAVDGDEDFRRRVAEAATDARIGAVGMLWLERPSGWEDRLAELEEAAAADAAAASHEHEARKLRRSLQGAEAALAKAEQAAATATSRANRAQEAWADERQAREAVEQALVELEARLAEARDERNQAVRALKEHDARNERTISGLRAELAAALAPPAPALAPAVEPPVEAGGLSRKEAAAVIAQLRSAVSALGAAAALIDPEADVTGDSVLGPVGRGAAPARAGSRRRAGGPARRRPSALPPATYAESSEAAEHLVRLPGVLVLVDGYNVTKTAWPDLTPVEQRSRLVSALDELHARTGADPFVVFDGVSAGPPPPGQPRVRTVRVRFTDADTEADDEILDQIEQHPAERPVVVVSSDRRVLDGARARGANVLTSPQFLATLRR